MGDRLWAGKISPKYVTSHQGKLGVDKLSTSYLAGVKMGCVHLCRVAGNTVWSHMASDTS